MKKYLCLVLLLSSFNLFGQLENIDLSQYKVPDYTYKSMGFDFNTNGNFGIGHNSKLDSKLLWDRSISSGLDIGVTYNRDVSTRKKQSYIEAQVDLGTSFYFNRRDTLVFRKNFNNNISYSFKRNNRYYYKTNQFFSTVFNQSNSYSNSSYKQDALNTETAIGNSIFINSTNIGIYHGYGRVENVTDFWKAYRIYEDLINNQLLSDTMVSMEDVALLSDLMYLNDRSRYFDRREHFKNDLRVIFNHFGDEIVDDVEAFLSIRDMAFYGVYNNRRYSGNVLTYGLDGDFEFKDKKTSFIDPVKDKNRINRNYQGYFKISYNSYKPINVKWQRDMLISLSIGSNDLMEEMNKFSVKPNFTYRISYYPNSRTYASTSIILKNDNVYEMKDFNTKYFDFIWDGSFNYYLSPQVRWSSSIRLNYAFDDYAYSDRYSVDKNTISREWDLHYRSTITYALF